MDSKFCEIASYNLINRIIYEELTLNIKIENVVSSNIVAWNPNFEENYSTVEDLSFKDILGDYNKGIGIYMIWEVVENISHQNSYKLECVYVGKGHVEDRMLVHNGKMSSNQCDFFISFYQCKNRIAKYLEQLILDLYPVRLNKAENTAKTKGDDEKLYSIVDSDEAWFGKGHESACRYALKNT
ncbi:hypothetical protein [Vibrio splendidus]|uniref:hypothetical protein n=1 Tax=Vibrio splendidus TaxID=29497 RepID=UPI001FB54CC2|nr:hypothetical protein [Vibrio splendidus]UOE86755.1 hypothetical protein LTQ54_16135 [Vibrio splendidus]